MDFRSQQVVAGNEIFRSDVEDDGGCLIVITDGSGGKGGDDGCRERGGGDGGGGEGGSTGGDGDGGGKRTDTIFPSLRPKFNSVVSMVQVSAVMSYLYEFRNRAFPLPPLVR